MIPILIGVVVVALFTPCIAWAVARWADREEAAERARLDRRLKSLQAAIELVQILDREAGRTPPMAPGLKSDHRRIS